MAWIQKQTSPPVAYADALDLETLEHGATHRLAIALIENSAGRSVRVPVLVARGAKPGPVVGITAALHGNELNGIPTIHRLFKRIDPSTLNGDVVAVLIANMPAYVAERRKFTDGVDLNHVMPGVEDGNESKVYAHRLMTRIVRHFNYLIDLHTASFGRVNSLYVRADMTDPVTARMARTIGADIVLHSKAGEGTLRTSASRRGIKSITLEIGDPHIFDPAMIQASRIGIRDVLEDLGMLKGDAEIASPACQECARSYWLYTDTGGLLRVIPPLTQRVAQGDVIATLTDPWGHIIRTYLAPEDGIVIGKSSNPCATTGARILHLGIEGLPEDAS